MTLLVAGGSGAGQTPRPLGSEFTVNADPANWQFDTSISAAADGGFVVTWQQYAPAQPDPNFYAYAIGSARRFDADGVPLSGDLEVARTLIRPIPSEQLFLLEFQPSVATDGRFVVVYGTHISYYNSGDIFGRRFDATGLPLGHQNVSDSNFSQLNVLADLDRGADDRFVVVWRANDVFGSRIVARRVAADGVVEPGPLTEVDTDAGMPVDRPAVAKAPNGDFFVVWERSDPVDGKEIAGRKFTGDGTPLTGEFVVNAQPAGNQTFPEVTAVADGGFAVVWVDEAGRDGSLEGVFGRRVDADGTPFGADFAVNAEVTGHQYWPKIAAIAPGFAVVWTDEGGHDGSGRGVFLRTFRLDGTPASGDVLVPNETFSHQGFPGIARTGDDLTVVWETETGSLSEGEIAARRFRVPLFDDGFESGDTSAWSAAVP